MKTTTFFITTIISAASMASILIKSSSLVEISLALTLWSLLHARILFLRAQNLKIFTNQFPIHLSFWFGSICPILNVGIWLFYLFEEEKD